MASHSSHTLVVIGQVGRPHGVRGELRVFPEDPESDALSYVKQVFLRPAADTTAPAQRFALRRARWQHRFWILSLASIDHRDAAAAWTGASCWVRRDSLRDPQDDEFYYCDLVGLQVYAPDHTLIGEVVELFFNGAHDVLVYQHVDGPVEMVPFIDDFIDAIDLAAGTIHIHPPLYT